MRESLSLHISLALASNLPTLGDVPKRLYNTLSASDKREKMPLSLYTLLYSMFIQLGIIYREPNIRMDFKLPQAFSVPKF